MGNVIEVKNVSKRDEMGRSVLSDVSFSLEQGQHLAILGPQGAGKTTLGRILCGLEKTDQGTVTICGEEIHSKMESERAAMRNRYIGYIPSHTHIVDALTLEQNMELSYDLCFGKKGGRKAKKEKIDALLEGLQLKTYRHYRNASLDPLKRCQACLAVQLLKEPEILLIDDSFMYLSVKEAEVLQPMLKELTKDISVVYMGSAQPKWMECNQIKMIDRGLIQEDVYA